MRLTFMNNSLEDSLNNYLKGTMDNPRKRKKITYHYACASCSL